MRLRVTWRERQQEGGGDWWQHVFVDDRRVLVRISEEVIEDRIGEGRVRAEVGRRIAGALKAGVLPSEVVVTTRDFIPPLARP